MPMVTWQGPDGSRQTTPLEQAPPQVQTLYTEKYQQPQAQLQETNAAAGAAGASAVAAQESAKKTAQEIAKNQILGEFGNALGALKPSGSQYVPPKVYNDMKTKAVSSGVGITSDDFDKAFQATYTDPTNAIDYNTGTGAQYRQQRAQVANNIVPNINTLLKQYDQLQHKGPSDNFMTNLPGANMFDVNRPEAQYEASRNAFAPSLKALTAGADSGLRLNIPEIQNMANLLPSIYDQPDTIKSKLTQLHAAVSSLTQGKEGIDTSVYQKYVGGKSAPGTPPAQGSQPPPPPQSGGAKDLLSTLLTNAGGDIKGDIQGAQKNKLFGINSLNPADAGNNIKTLLGIPQEYGDLIAHPQQHAVNHPVNTALDLLPFLGLLKGGGGMSDIEGGNGGATIKDPSALQKIFAPNQIKKTAGAMRDGVVQQASQAGGVIPGDNIVSQLQQWAENIGKPGNPGQHAKIDAIINEAQNTYGGKVIDPVQAHKIYNEVDSGYNQKGVQKDAIQSRGDIALRGILRGELDKVAPGFDKLTNIIGQGYNAEKSAGAQMIKKLPQNALKAGLNVAGLGILRDFIGL